MKNHIDWKKVSKKKLSEKTEGKEIGKDVVKVIAKEEVVKENIIAKEEAVKNNIIAKEAGVVKEKLIEVKENIIEEVHTNILSARGVSYYVGFSILCSALRGGSPYGN